MKKWEKILGISALVSLVMNFNLISGGTMLSMIFITVLSCFYYFLGFAYFNQISLSNIFKKDSYKGISALKIILGVLLGLSLSAICIGVVFKMQNWRGANLNLITGLTSSFFILIIVLIKLKTKGDFFKRTSTNRIFLIGTLGLIFLFVSDLQLKKIKYRNHPDYLRAYEEYIKNPINEGLKQKMETEYYKIFFPPTNSNQKE